MGQHKPAPKEKRERDDRCRHRHDLPPKFSSGCFKNISMEAYTR